MINMSGSLSYTATSLEDVAKSFEARGKECERQANVAERAKHREYYRAQAGAWSTAAEILRQTKLVSE